MLRGKGLGDVDTSVYGPAVNWGNQSVEDWRPLITKNAGTLPVDFLMAWLGPESNGNPCSWTSKSEAGIFQLDPENASNAGTSTAEQHPVPPCATGAETYSSFAALTDDQAQVQVSAGINYVNGCVAYTDAELAKYGYSIGAGSADYWSFVKMCHVGVGYMDQLLSCAVDGNGGAAPASWADTLSACASNTGSPYAYLASASGTHTASVTGQYGAGSNGALNFLGNALSSAQYLTPTEWVLMLLAGFVGVGGAFWFQRWLAKGEAHAMPVHGLRR
jgi:hypothetical protein